jgi:hypothetical protein
MDAKTFELLDFLAKAYWNGLTTETESEEFIEKLARAGQIRMADRFRANLTVCDAQEHHRDLRSAQGWSGM